MEFGLFMELSVPRPWTPGSERQVYENALEQVRLADELGFDYVWAVEHHFLEEYSHCSAPDLFLTASAMQTKRIRVGHGVVACVPQYQSPIRIAERAAVLDILSGGRVELGTGRSATWTELGGFGANPDETKKTWDEFVRVIPKMWMQERFSWQGRAFSMPERAVLPKPVQRPHPPMWVAVTSPGTELDAADRGLGCLGLAPGGFAESERKVKIYRSHVENCDPVGSFVNDKVSTINFLSCAEDGDRARRGGNPSCEHLQLHGLATPVGQGGPPDALVPVGGTVARVAARVGRSGRCRPRFQRSHDGHPRRRCRSDPQVGIRRVRRNQLLRQLHGDTPSAAGPRQPPAVRRGGHASVQARTERACNRQWRNCGGRRLMPLAGSLDIRVLLEGAPTVTLDGREVRIDNVEILQVLYEIEARDIEALVPPALNPDDSARRQLSRVPRRRKPVRSLFDGAGPRPPRARPSVPAFLVSAVCDNPTAAEALSTSWGFRILPGTIRMVRFHDRVNCSVDVDRRTILQLALVDPEPITGHDIQYAPGMHLARVQDDKGIRPRLVQVDTEYEFRRADRGRPELGTFDAAAWGDERLVPTQPVSASCTTCDVIITPVRYICNPDIPAAEGTQNVEQSAANEPEPGTA